MDGAGLAEIKRLAAALAGRIQNDFRATGHKFEDSEFPTNDSSIFVQPGRPWDGAPKKFRWARTTDLSEAPDLFVGGTEAGDVMQGKLGDCWFLGALSVVATRKDLCSKLFLKFDPECGFVQCLFFKEMSWVVVTCDDCLPIDPDDGKLLFSHCKDSRENWVPLLEKCYAKLHGSYEALNGGVASEALEDLTGGNEEILWLAQPEIRELIESGEFWKKMLSFEREGFLLSAARMAEEDANGSADGHGLLPGHVYGLLDFHELRTGARAGQRLVKLRNPWGKGEWEGAWSDNSSTWDADSAREVGLVQGNDGTFWMSFEDFCSAFGKLYISRLYFDEVGEVWSHKVFQDEWSTAAGTAGGCTKYKTWRCNPAFLLLSPSDGPEGNAAFISLNLADVRMRAGARGIRAKDWRPRSPHCGFYVVKMDSAMAKKVAFVSGDEVVAESNGFSDGRGRSVELELERGVLYAIVPATFTPSVDAQFFLSVWSRYPVECDKLIERVAASADGQWSGPVSGGKHGQLRSGGGCFNHASWRSNPQYCVSVDNDCLVHIVLAASTLSEGSNRKGEESAVGFYVFQSAEADECSLVTDRLLGGLIAQSGHVEGGYASLSTELVAGDYAIVPTLFRPLSSKGRIPFSLRVYSDEQLELVQMKHSVAGVEGEWKAPLKAGGCLDLPTWKENPFHYFQLSKPGRVTLVLALGGSEQKGTPRPTPGQFRGFIVMNGKVKPEDAVREDIAHVSVYSDGPEVVRTIDLPAGFVTVVPSTKEVGVEGSYQLLAMAPFKVLGSVLD